MQIREKRREKKRKEEILQKCIRCVGKKKTCDDKWKDKTKGKTKDIIETLP